MYVRFVVLGLHVFCRGGLRKGKGGFGRASAGAVRWKDTRSPLYNRFFSQIHLRQVMVPRCVSDPQRTGIRR
jgi:hypothetical protein